MDYQPRKTPGARDSGQYTFKLRRSRVQHIRSTSEAGSDGRANPDAPVFGMSAADRKNDPGLFMRVSRDWENSSLTVTHVEFAAGEDFNTTDTDDEIIEAVESRLGVRVDAKHAGAIVKLLRKNPNSSIWRSNGPGMDDPERTYFADIELMYAKGLDSGWSLAWRLPEDSPEDVLLDEAEEYIVSCYQGNVYCPKCGSGNIEEETLSYCFSCLSNF